jgi:hypothetical protein
MSQKVDITSPPIDSPPVVLSGSKRTSKPRAIELFAGVGGFRLGLGEEWDVVWSNQWNRPRNVNMLPMSTSTISAKQDMYVRISRKFSKGSKMKRR